MAKELSRTFDHGAGAVHVVVEDEHQHQSHHTFYVVGPAGVTDMKAAVAERMAEIDTHAAHVRERMIAAGWTPTA